jgi:hypothetical protein
MTHAIHPTPLAEHCPLHLAGRARSNLCNGGFDSVPDRPELPMSEYSRGREGREGAHAVDDHCCGWPGVDIGIRAPYVGECQLSESEVNHAVIHGLLMDVAGGATCE